MSAPLPIGPVQLPPGPGPTMGATQGSSGQGSPAIEASDPGEEAVVTGVTIRPTAPPLRAHRPHLSSRLKAAMEKRLQEAPLEGLFEFVLERDATHRRALVLLWLQTQAALGHFPSGLLTDLEEQQCADWVEKHSPGILRGLLEELDGLRTYRRTDNVELAAAVTHINKTMAAHWRFCHH